VTLDVEIDGIPSVDALHARSDIGIKGVFDAGVAYVYVKAFQKNTRVHLPEGGVPNAVASLTRDVATSTWKGQLSLDNPSGAVVFLAYAVDSSGQQLYSGTYEIPNINGYGHDVFTIPVTGNTNPNAAAGAYVLASPSDEFAGWGPGGGWVFYDKKSYTSGWRYLEAAPVSWNGEPENEGQGAWGMRGTLVPGLSAVIGSGKLNTETLAAYNTSHSLTGTAAQVCQDINFNAFTDWYLPSINELTQMDANLKQNAIGDLQTDKYWSSSQYDTNMGRLYDFDPEGGSITNNKDDPFFFRPVRQF